MCVTAVRDEGPEVAAHGAQGWERAWAFSHSKDDREQVASEVEKGHWRRSRSWPPAVGCNHKDKVNEVLTDHVCRDMVSRRDTLKLEHMHDHLDRARLGAARVQETERRHSVVRNHVPETVLVCNSIGVPSVNHHLSAERPGRTKDVPTRGPA